MMKRILGKIIYTGIDKNLNAITIEHYKWLNIFIFTNTIFQILLCVFAIFYFNKFIVVNFIVIICLLLGYYFIKFRFNVNVWTFVITLLTLNTFYTSSYLEKESLAFLHYLSIIFSLPFIYIYKKHKAYIASIILLIVVLFSIDVLTNFSLFDINKFSEKQKVILRAEAVIFTIAYLLIISTFIYIKQNNLYKIILKNSELKSKVKNEHSYLENELDEFAKQSKISNNGFLLKFHHYFPDFEKKLKKICPNIINSELEVCAMMKLNFTTKEIAISTNSSVASIKNKKYRIRKKLGLETGTDLNLYLMKM